LKNKSAETLTVLRAVEVACEMDQGEKTCPSLGSEPRLFELLGNEPEAYCAGFNWSHGQGARESFESPWNASFGIASIQTLFVDRSRVRGISFKLFVSTALAQATRPADRPPGMVWIPSGEFLMGTDDPNEKANERPAHRVLVDGFWMDATAVTNADFRKFVNATGHVTTAERPVDWEEMSKQVAPGTPRPPEEMLALEFQLKKHIVMSSQQRRNISGGLEAVGRGLADLFKFETDGRSQVAAPYGSLPFASPGTAYGISTATAAPVHGNACKFSIQRDLRRLETKGFEPSTFALRTRRSPN
jgi:hypothetical protein